MLTFGNGRRVAIIAGVRTPFARSGTALKEYTAIDLGRFAVGELVQRTSLDGAAVDLLVFGTVVQSVVAPNIAREVALMPRECRIGTWVRLSLPPAMATCACPSAI